jgi:putative ABC transport system permease protein
MSFALAADVPMQVVGTLASTDLLGAPYVVSHDTLVNRAGKVADSAVYVNAAGRPDAAQAAITGAVAGTPGVEVQDQASFREEQEGQVNQVLGLMMVLLALAVIVALLGIANTLALSVFERTREIGLLRAVGMTRRQTRRMVTWESVIVAVFGALLGLGVGTLFGWAVVAALAEEGITTLVVPGGQLVVYLVAAGVAGVVAATFPAWRAARLDVLEAVTTE